MRSKINQDHQRRRRKGAVLVVVASSIVILVGVLALSLDVGFLYQMRRKTQVAADAASEAGAIELYNKYAANKGYDRDGAAHNAAVSNAAAHSFGTTGSNSTVTVNIPPSSGSFAGKPGYVETIITHTSPPRFSSIFSRSSLVVTTRSVAAGTLIDTQGGLLILDPKRKDSLKVKGKNSQLQVDADIIVDSADKRAVKVDKRGQITADHLLVTGGVDKKSKGNIDAEVSTGVPATSDPYSGLSAPPKGTNRKADDYKTTSGGVDYFDLQPGTYSELKFDKNDVVRMAPGIYYVDGGRVEFKDNSSLQAYGVMIYDKGKKGMNFRTSGDLTMTPPTSGAYAGISLFQDQNSKTKVQFKNKNGTININGIVYAANSEVKFNATDADFGDDSDDGDDDAESDDYTTEDDSGASQTPIGASFVCRKFTLEKNSNVRIMGAGIAAQRPLLSVVE